MAAKFGMSRSPEFTVLCRSGERIWFLLQQGQFHQGCHALASALLSTGVSPLRGTPGERRYVQRRGQIAIHDQAPRGMLAVDRAVGEREVSTDPPTARAGLRRRRPAT